MLRWRPMVGRPRLVIALVVAALLGAFLVFTAFGGQDQLLVSVGQLRADKDGAATKTVQLTGTVISASKQSDPMRFVLADFGTPQRVAVAYSGSVPDAFKVGRSVIVTGRLQDGMFVAQRDSLLTKCPSKYSADGGGQ